MKLLERSDVAGLTFVKFSLCLRIKSLQENVKFEDGYFDMWFEGYSASLRKGTYPPFAIWGGGVPPNNLADVAGQTVTDHWKLCGTTFPLRYWKRTFLCSEIEPHRNQ